MAREIGVAVLGYGFMGTTHLTAWSMVSNVKVRAIVGRDRAKVERVARRFSVAFETSLSEALEEHAVEIVDICTPSFTHRDYAVEALNAGMHVLVEKPMALSLREADEMIEAADAHGRKLMVAHVLRFFPEYVKVKGLVQAGTIGHPVMVRAVRTGSIPPWGIDSWFMDQSKSGGVAADLAIHDIDFLRWCLQDEVESVFALTHRRSTVKTFVEDHALISLEFGRGTVAHVEASWAMPTLLPFTTGLEVEGPLGRLSVDSRSTSPLTIVDRNGARYLSPQTRPWVESMPFPIDPFYDEIQHFVDCVLQDRRPISDGPESRRSLEVAIAAVRSAADGSPISLQREA